MHYLEISVAPPCTFKIELLMMKKKTLKVKSGIAIAPVWYRPVRFPGLDFSVELIASKIKTWKK